jgi:hypothetical protein
MAVFLGGTEDEKRAAHFDCLRIGLDLAVIGLVALFAMFRLVLKTSTSATISTLAAWQPPLLMIQFFLIMLATLFSALYYSPQRNFGKGVFIPQIVGWLSIYISSAVFTILYQGP